MKIIIYGIGKRYYNLFSDPEFIEKVLIINNIEVIGFADGNDMIYGKEIIYLNQRFKIKKMNEFSENSFDKIVVITKKYFQDVKHDLILMGYKKDQIIQLDMLYESYLDEIFHIKNFVGKIGIEIGGPTYLFFNIYSKCFSCDNVNFSSSTVWGKSETNIFTYNEKKIGCNLIAEATDMHQIPDEKYEFVLSSNNLEHIANPLKALNEFKRILKKEGCILIIVPNKEKTFDHNREYTLFEHLQDDYSNNIEEDDLSHLSEIIEKHDYNMDPACGGKENFIERAKANVTNRCLHHHVFNEPCLRKAFQFIGFDIFDFGKIENNLYIIGHKKL